MWLGRDWLRRAVLGAVAVIAAVAAACGDDGPSGYGPDHRAEFVDECTTDVASEQACACFYDRLAAEVPFERFEALDAATDDDLPPDIAALAAGCAAGGA